MPRLFISCQIPQTPALRRLHRQLSELPEGLRPDPPHNWHLTLKFLGDTDSTLIPQVEQILRTAAQSTLCCRPVLKGLGAFPHPGRPSVVWVRLEDIAPLADLAAALENECARLGFPPEKRAFQPHVTVLRLRGRPPAAVFDLLREHAQTDFGHIEVKTVELMQSDLGPRGSTYTPLHSAPLASGSATDRSPLESPRPS